MDVSLACCKEWQEVVLSCGRRVDAETDRWATAVLNKTMDVEFKSEIFSSLKEVDVKQRGDVVMFCLIAQRIFECNKDATTALIEYVTKLTFVI